MPITALPEPPSRSDPANFPERADAFMSALPQFAQEANTLQEQVDEAAVAADESAIAAGSSAQDSATRRDQAGQFANSASQSMQAAELGATAAETARDLAKAWASQSSGTVDGTVFLSAYQYAQQAAIGAGLPIYAANAIPTTDQGDIYVAGLGPMRWNGTMYVMTQYGHGECQFRFVSTTECHLFPYNGNGLIINGKQYRIPAAGVPITSAATVASTAHYVYAKDAGSGSIALEAQTIVAAPHSTHIDGVEIKTGDPTRTLVGMVEMNASNQFNDGQDIRGVASWFNRRPRSTTVTFTGGPTTSTAFVNISGSSLLSWAGEDVLVTGAGTTIAAVVNTGILIRLSMGTSVQYNGGITQATAGGSATWAWHRAMPPGLFTADDLRVLTGAIATNNAANSVSMSNGLLTMTSNI